jgi:hypothetical protein
MIARRWHGRIKAKDRDRYLALMRDVGLVDYKGTEGNLDAWCLHRQEGDIVHVEMLTLWRDWQAIERFAGQPLDKAKYYDFDPDFLLELEPAVTHFEVVAS